MVIGFSEKLEKDSYYLGEIGRVLTDAGRFEEAKTYLNSAIIDNPSNSGYHRLLGLALEANQENDKALASYKRSLELHYPDPAEVNGRIERLEKKTAK